MLEKELTSLLTDEQIKKITDIHNHRQGFIFFKTFHLPYVDDEAILPETNGFLSEYLEYFFSKRGLLIDGKFIRAAGFLDSQLFDILNQHHGLILEDLNFMGVSMAHGKYSHALHWWIFCKAIERGDITLPANMSLAELITAMHTEKLYGGLTVFEALLDMYSLPSFRSPEYISSYVMTETNRLPLLSALLTISLIKHVRRNTALHFNSHVKTLDVMLLQLFSEQSFMSMKNRMGAINHFIREDKRDISVVCSSEDGTELALAGMNKIGLYDGEAYIKNPNKLPRHPFFAAYHEERVHAEADPVFFPAYSYQECTIL